MVAPRICVRGPCETTVAGAQFQFGLPNENARGMLRSEEHTSELQSRLHLVCRLLLEKKKHAPRCRRALPITLSKSNEGHHAEQPRSYHALYRLPHPGDTDTMLPNSALTLYYTA